MSGQEIFADYLLPLTYLLAGVAFVAAIIGALVSAFQKPKEAAGTLVALAVMAVIFFIGYSMSDATVTERQLNEFNVTPEISQVIGGVLRMLYVLMGITVVAAVWNSISKIFK